MKMQEQTQNKIIQMFQQILTCLINNQTDIALIWSIGQPKVPTKKHFKNHVKKFTLTLTKGEK